MAYAIHKSELQVEEDVSAAEVESLMQVILVKPLIIKDWMSLHDTRQVTITGYVRKGVATAQGCDRR